MTLYSHIMSTEAGGAFETSNRLHSITCKNILTLTCNRNVSTAHPQTPFSLHLLPMINNTKHTVKDSHIRIIAATLIDVPCCQCMFHKADACCTRNKQISTSPSRITPAALYAWSDLMHGPNNFCSTNNLMGKTYRRFSCINIVLFDRLRDGHWKA